MMEEEPVSNEYVSSAWEVSEIVDGDHRDDEEEVDDLIAYLQEETQFPVSVSLRRKGLHGCWFFLNKLLFDAMFQVNPALPVQPISNNGCCSVKHREEPVTGDL